jgi:hypothetical protein
MKTKHCLTLSSVVLALLTFSAAAHAQVREVVVGITPTCPYGLTGCWGGASEGLARLGGVESVAKAPDAYNSTAHVHLTDHEMLPDVEKWRHDFKATANDAYGFRGVEVTIEASVVTKDSALFLRLPNQTREIRLAPLRHKLQWNFKKGSPRQPEPDEAAAFESLAAEVRKVSKGELRAMVTGPLVQQDGVSTLEVREFFPMKD